MIWTCRKNREIKEERQKFCKETDWNDVTCITEKCFMTYLKFSVLWGEGGSGGRWEGGKWEKGRL